MKSKLLLVADFGRLKAFRLEEDPHFSRPRLKLMDDWETHVTNHLSEEVTDQAGRYRKSPGSGAGASPLSDGEQHNLDLERRKRALKNLAQRIQDLVQKDGVDGCYLAADSRINKALMDELRKETRAKIEKSIPVNLSNASNEDVLRHFWVQPQPV